jgi:hypothetical protein
MHEVTQLQPTPALTQIKLKLEDLLDGVEFNTANNKPLVRPKVREEVHAPAPTLLTCTHC